MSSPQKLDKIATNCVECNYLKESMTKFSCNHLICKECLLLLLVEKEFNYTKLTSDIVLACPECEGTVKNPQDAPVLKLKKEELKKLLSSSNNSPLKCIKHSKEIKYFCESCNEEICDDCKKVDKEHENSQIEIQDIKNDAAEKLLLNQSLNLEQIKSKINENKSKISSEVQDSLKKTKEKIKLVITELNNLLTEVEKKSKENEKFINEFFDMLTVAYEKYYSMMNSPQLSLQVIKKMSSMKNIININLLQNSDLYEQLDSLNTFIDNN